MHMPGLFVGSFQEHGCLKFLFAKCQKAPAILFPRSRDPCNSLLRKYCGCYCVSGLFVLGSSLRSDHGQAFPTASAFHSPLVCTRVEPPAACKPSCAALPE